MKETAKDPKFIKACEVISRAYKNACKNLINRMIC